MLTRLRRASSILLAKSISITDGSSAPVWPVSDSLVEPLPQHPRHERLPSNAAYCVPQRRQDPHVFHLSQGDACADADTIFWLCRGWQRPSMAAADNLEVPAQQHPGNGRLAGDIAGHALMRPLRQ